MNMTLNIRNTVTGSIALLLSFSFLHSQTINPGDVAGLQLWLNAGSGVTTNESSHVTQWNDISEGTSYNAVQASAALPLYQPTAGGGGSPTLGFSGGNNLAASGAQSTVSNSLTLFVVFSLNAVGQNHMLVDSKQSTSNNRGFYLAVRNNDRLEFRVQNEGASGFSLNQTIALPTNPIGEYYVAMARIDTDGTGTLRILDTIDTVEREQTLTNISGSGAFTIGSNSSASPSFYLDGAISSVLLYDHALSDLQANAVYNYLYEHHVIPEPATVAVLSCGALLGVILVRRMRLRWRVG